jgi:hypothetical protein
VQSEIAGSEFHQLVEDASRNAVVWNPEDIGVQYEDDVLWGSWAQADQERSYRSAYADDSAWPRSVTRDLWDALVTVWDKVGWADDVLDALSGGETEIAPEAQRVIGAMEVLADALADESEGSVRTVARALATRVLKLGVKISVDDDQLPHEALSEAFGWYLGVDVTYGWSTVEASAEGMESAVTGWVGKVTALRGVWKSQAAAVSALVLHGASPREARAAARATFAAR